MLGLLKKFNKLDLVLFILAALVLAGAYLFLKGGNSSPIAGVLGSETNKDVYFVVEIMYTQGNFEDLISLGDVIKDSSREFYYGVVSNIEVEPTKITTNNSVDGEFVQTIVPERYTVNITVKSNGTESDTEIKAEGQIIKVGKRMNIKSKGYAGTGFVTALWTEDIRR